MFIPLSLIIPLFVTQTSTCLLDLLRILMIKGKSTKNKIYGGWNIFRLFRYFIGFVFYRSWVLYNKLKPVGPSYRKHVYLLFVSFLFFIYFFLLSLLRWFFKELCPYVKIEGIFSLRRREVKFRTRDRRKMKGVTTTYTTTTWE